MNPHSKSHLWTWVAVVVVILVLYVLSIGPVNAEIMEHRPNAYTPNPQWYVAVYGPVEGLARTAGCGDWLLNYKNWWRVQLFHSR